MLTAFKHLRRLHGIAHNLARHDALFALEHPEIPAPLRYVIRAYAWLYGRQHDGHRPGERLRQALTTLGPSFIKLGQALSVRPDVVGEELADDLGQLRDRLTPFSASKARAAVEKEFKRPLRQLFASFDEKPVAAASIAQVHFATTVDGRDVAVKILRPGIEEAFGRDFELFRWLATTLERWVPSLRRLRPVQVVETLAEAVAIEMDLRLEAAAAAELAENFRDDPDFRVPTVDWQRTGRRVLTLQRVAGISIGDRAALVAAGHDLGAIATRVIRTFLKQALRDGLFHADLHQGNIFVAEDGALEAVDFGIVGRLDKPTRRFMADMLQAFLTGDYRRAAEVHFEAGYVPQTKSVEAFAQACRSIGAPILDRPVNEISIGRLLAQLFAITETFAMQTQPQLLLLQKTMVTAEGVARRLDPNVNFWSAAQPVVESWMMDHMNPEARLREAAEAVGRLIVRFPALVADLDRAPVLIGRGGLQLDPAGLRLLAEEQARARRPLLAAVWALSGLIAALLLIILWDG